MSARFSYWMKRTSSGAGAISSILLSGVLWSIYGQTPTSSPRATPTVRYAVVQNRVQPEYSSEARAAGLQGSVILCVDIGPTGHVDRVYPIQHLGLGLDEKTIEAVKNWQFKPGELDGRPIAVKQSVEVRFELDQTPSWRVDRAAFLVRRSRGERLNEVAAPIFNHYVRPDDAPCLVDGGTTLVDVAISKGGKPSLIEFVGEHSEAAGHALSQVINLWRFDPARLNGTPHDSTVTFAMGCGARATGSPGDERAAASEAPPVTENSSPALLWKVEPDYTEEARRAKRQGTVQIHLVVDAAGHATRLLIIHPLGFGMDEQAMEAVTKWRFKPAIKDGKPVSRSATIQVNFRLL